MPYATILSEHQESKVIDALRTIPIAVGFTTATYTPTVAFNDDFANLDCKHELVVLMEVAGTMQANTNVVLNLEMPEGMTYQIINTRTTTAVNTIAEFRFSDRMTQYADRITSIVLNYANAVGATYTVKSVCITRQNIDTNDITITPSGTQDVNITQVAGSAVTVGSGVVTANTLRVTQATDVPINTDFDSIKGVAVEVNTGSVGAGVQRVTLANDDVNMQYIRAQQIKDLHKGVNGLDIYSNVKNDFTATPTVGAKTITLVGYVGTLAMQQVLFIIRYSSTGVREVVDLSMCTVAGAVITATGMLTNFDAGDTVLVCLMYNDKAYDSTNNAIKNMTQNPACENRDPNQQIYTALGDGTRSYYFTMDTFYQFSLDIINTNGAAGNNAVTFGATSQADGTAAAACTYDDMTNEWFGAASFALGAGMNRFVKSTAESMKYMRVTIVRTADGGGSDGAYTFNIIPFGL